MMASTRTQKPPLAAALLLPNIGHSFISFLRPAEYSG